MSSIFLFSVFKYVPHCFNYWCLFNLFHIPQMPLLPGTLVSIYIFLELWWLNMFRWMFVERLLIYLRCNCMHWCGKRFVISSFFYGPNSSICDSIYILIWGMLMRCIHDGRALSNGYLLILVDSSTSTGMCPFNPDNCTVELWRFWCCRGNLRRFF